MNKVIDPSGTCGEIGGMNTTEPRAPKTLETLLQTSDKNRDQSWEDQFLFRLSESNLKVLAPDPQNGPDSWPYLMVETDSTSSEPAQKVLEWLSLRGIGMAVNPNKDYPDFVLSYGMIWNFRKTGRFIHRVPQRTTGLWTAETKDLQAGAPTEDYLPGFVRKILREFFRDQGVFEPRILMISDNGKDFDLAFSLESLGSPKDTEHESVAEAISWFLPSHYSIVLVSEKGLPEFVKL